jgi:YkoY family integral membrane protein
MSHLLFDAASGLTWHALLLLPVLIALETVLSADNAVALAAIAQGLSSHELQRRALNLGLVAAFVLRVVLILTATWVIKYWQFQLLGAAYLLWLVFQHFITADDDDNGTGEHHHAPRFSSLWQAIPTIALTDLAFSLDSVTTAIAVSQNIILVLLGGLAGVIALRVMAGLFIQWLEKYTYLEDAGFLTVALVGLKLLLRVVHPEWIPPEWVILVAIALLFVWGFSHQKPDEMPDLSAELSAIAGEKREPQEMSAD